MTHNYAPAVLWCCLFTSMLLIFVAWLEQVSGRTVRGFIIVAILMVLVPTLWVVFYCIK